MDYTYLPTPLAISLDRVRDARGDVELDPWGQVTFEATSPEYPGLFGRSSDADEATQQLLDTIMYALPIAPEVTHALQDAGYPLEVVEAWERETEGCADRSFRHHAVTAVATLRAYTNAGIPALAACGFATLLDVVDATAVHAAGCTSQDVRRYAQMADSSGWWETDFEIIRWLRAGIVADRGALYVDHCTVEQAVAWEAFLEANEVPDDDLRSLVRIGVQPQDVADGFPVHRASFYAHCTAPWLNAVEWEAFASRHGVSDADLVGLFHLFVQPKCVAHTFPLHRAAFYAECGASWHVAMAWENALAEYGQQVDDSDLRDILAAGLEPECLLEYSAASEDAGFALGQAARTLLGLTPR
ncbi:hypothetical protein [Nocardioides zhouii]|uniref:Uncharacterized protein n=1 Tax=Nocardioides zhouii TaxID=1168729 RepID=A0A4Q2SNK2_9ACTN|nr:hypothetical protein [Nocardioides zhouii]RYC05648.1 hypothetical protein EUA94_18035 [Nocardioides zhouii]